MSSVVLSGLTMITTINLLEEHNIAGFIDDIKKVGCWFHNLLPSNKFIQCIIYLSGSIMLVRTIPILLRNTEFFSYFNREIQYFHRSSNHKQILNMKNELLMELKDGSANLPLFDDKLIILELNIGGGTNLSFYPEGAYLIATDFLENSREKLENNFLLENKIILNQYIQTCPEELSSVPDETVSCVVCFHSLCSARNAFRALQEIKRVLIPGGKLYFIEHTLETKKFSRFWFIQMNFRVNMFMLDCCMKKVEDYLENAGFSELQFKREMLDTTHFIGPMLSLAPHVYGYARK